MNGVEMAQPDPEEIAKAIAERMGTPEYDRRLSDKLLAAFNHAYALGAHAIATRLRAILADVAEAELAGFDRRGDSAQTSADLWVAFVESRTAYNRISSEKRADEEAVESALMEMQEAYRRWSEV